MKKIIVFGTFDIFHPGHLDFFKQAKMLGDYLIVVVARDENVEKIKGKLSYNNEEKRVKEIKSLLNFKRLFVKNFHLQNKYIVDEVLLGNKNDKYLILKEKLPDTICLGYDQKVNLKELQKKLKEYKMNKVQVIRLKAYKSSVYKSSKLKYLF